MYKSINFTQKFCLLSSNISTSRIIKSLAMHHTSLKSNGILKCHYLDSKNKTPTTCLVYCLHTVSLLSMLTHLTQTQIHTFSKNTSLVNYWMETSIMHMNFALHPFHSKLATTDLQTLFRMVQLVISYIYSLMLFHLQNTLQVAEPFSILF